MAKTHLALPTASKSALVLSGCTHWIGQAYYEDKYADTTKRDIGTSFHSGAELLLHGKTLHEAIAESERTMRSIWLDGRPGIQDANAIAARMLQHASKYVADRMGAVWCVLGTEIAMGYRLRDRERLLLGRVEDRAYPKESGVLWGTADIVGLNKYGLWLADWKTGGTDTARDQLMTLAGMLAPDGQAVTICTIKVTEDGCSDWDEYVSHHEIDSHMKEISARLSSRTEPVQGAHCVALYCNYLYACPSTALALEEMYAHTKK